MIKKIATIFCVIFLALTSYSCRQTLGYGVVLWSPDDTTIPTGSLVKVRSEIQRKAVYRVEPTQRPGETYEIDTWRIEFFKNKKNAIDYAKNYAFFARNFLENERAGLPLRVEPNTKSASDYKLEEGQQLKVLSHTKTREQIGAYKSYWYYVLTNDGEKGWAYGRYLRGYIISDTGVAIYDEKGYLGDALLENFFDPSITWRPSYYQEMISQEQVNLDLFKTEYGLFIDSNRKMINVNLPNVKGSYSYNSIVPVGGANYHFDGSNFSFSVSNREVIARFTNNGLKYKEVFVPIKNDRLEPAIREEMARRATKYRSFLDLGGAFLSDWGTLTLPGNNRFTLTGNKRFLDNVYLSNFDGNEGEMKFDLFVTDELAKKYDGAFSLVFDASGTRLNFVYSLTANGFEARLSDNLPANKMLSTELQLGTGPTILFKN